MQASCQYPDLGQTLDLKRIFKIRCDQEGDFLANIRNPGSAHCGYPATAQAKKSPGRCRTGLLVAAYLENQRRRGSVGVISMVRRAVGKAGVPLKVNTLTSCARLSAWVCIEAAAAAASSTNAAFCWVT